MPQRINYGGVWHVYPDNASDEQITNDLHQWGLQHGLQGQGQGNITSFTAPPGSDFGSEVNKATNKQVYDQTHHSMDDEFQSLIKVLPAIGGMLGGVPGAGVGAFAQQAMSKEPSLGEGAKDTFLQGVLPEMVGSLGSKIGNYFQTTFPKAIVGLKNPTVQKYVDQGVADLKTQAKGTGSFFTLQGPEESLLSAIDKGYNQTSARFEPTKVLEEIGKNPTGSPAEVNTVNFMNRLKQLEPEKNTVDGLLRYAKHRIVFDLTAGAAGGLAAGATGLPGAHLAGMATGFMLGNEGLKRIASSETLGKLALEALDTAPNSAKGQLLGKVLMNGLRGTEVMVQMSDGKTEKAVVGPNGELQPLRQQ